MKIIRSVLLIGGELDDGVAQIAYMSEDPPNEISLEGNRYSLIGANLPLELIALGISLEITEEKEVIVELAHRLIKLATPLVHELVNEESRTDEKPRTNRLN